MAESGPVESGRKFVPELAGEKKSSLTRQRPVTGEWRVAILQLNQGGTTTGSAIVPRMMALILWKNMEGTVLKDQLEQILNETMEKISNSGSTAVLEEVRVQVLGKKGLLTQL